MQSVHKDALQVVFTCQEVFCHLVSVSRGEDRQGNVQVSQRRLSS